MVKGNQQKHVKEKPTETNRNMVKGNQQKHGKGNKSEKWERKTSDYFNYRGHMRLRKNM